MEFDVQRTLLLQSGRCQPLVRVFGWNPWCISLGRNQSIDDIQLEKAYADGVDVLHRPTGGRAIFHAEELTYSVVMTSEGRSIMEVYKLIGEALITGLQLLAPGITLSKSQPDFQKLYKEPGGIPCFSSSARYEIEYNGKKLVGSAQRRFNALNANENDVVLQHGSVLIGAAHLGITDYLNSDGKTISALRHDLQMHTLTLNEICKRKFTFDEAAECIKRGFEEAWNIEFENEEPIEQVNRNLKSAASR